MHPVFTDKKEARAYYARLRAAIAEDAGEKERIDSLIVKAIVSSEAYICADVLLAYYPIRNEIDLRPLIERARLDGKQVALPVTQGGAMDFRLYTGELATGGYGIPVPTGERVGVGECTLCIVPGYACDEKHYRLGYGGGYYDRFLADFPGVSLGAFYSECTCAGFPVEKYDIPFDLLATEEGIF